MPLTDTLVPARNPNVEFDIDRGSALSQAGSGGPPATSVLGISLGGTALLAACGGGSESGSAANSGAGANSLEPRSGGSAGGGTGAPGGTAISRTDAARFLTQATFGMQSEADITALQNDGFDRWIDNQFNTPAQLHVDYLQAQRKRTENGYATEEMSYEAVWQQWLGGRDQLRGRMAFALAQIFVISNIAPDIRPHAMSSYMDLLNRNAFGNYRTLLQEVTLHPAMGYYLNMTESEKDDPARGIHPNENYAREVLQLFSVGLVELNTDGSQQRIAGKAIPTYGEAEVKGFAKAFSGWTFDSQNPLRPNEFHEADENLESNWTTPLRAFPSAHSPEPKKLLGKVTLAGGQTPGKDMAEALDNIFNHPNVGPFIARQLIQRFVTSNPSPAYIERVSFAFNSSGGPVRRGDYNNNGAGVGAQLNDASGGARGDFRAVIRAVLLDPEARNPDLDPAAAYGKQREPVIRFATFLRALNAASANGINSIHYLDGVDDGLGQSPLLAPSVFNYFSPNYRPPGPVAQAGLTAPEFQITTETSVVGSLNFFSNLFRSEGYGYDESRLELNLAPWAALATQPDVLVERLNTLFFATQMSAATRARLLQMVIAMPGRNDDELRDRVKAALTVTAIAPDFVIQK